MFWLDSKFTSWFDGKLRQERDDNLEIEKNSDASESKKEKRIALIKRDYFVFREFMFLSSSLFFCFPMAVFIFTAYRGFSELLPALRIFRELVQMHYLFITLAIYRLSWRSLRFAVFCFSKGRFLLYKDQVSEGLYGKYSA